MYKVLYVQKNEDIARQFMNEFLNSEYQLLIANTGEEALTIIGETDVLLLLVDINIPDMRVRRLVKLAKEISPAIIINVCVDVCDHKRLTKLVNRYGVHKIYVAPWNISEILYEIGDSIEVALINEETQIHESQLLKERKSLDETIIHLRTALQKQQFGYDKIKKLTDCFMEGIKDISGDEVPRRKHEFLADIFDKYLKHTTTGNFSIEGLEEGIKSDLGALRFSYPGVSYGNIISCFFGGVTRLDASNCRYAVWLIARFFAEFYEKVNIDINTHFTTTTEAKFLCKISTSGESLPDDVRRDRNGCAKLIEKILNVIVRNPDIEERDGIYQYGFLVRVKDE